MPCKNETRWAVSIMMSVTRGLDDYRGRHLADSVLLEIIGTLAHDGIVDVVVELGTNLQQA